MDPIFFSSAKMHQIILVCCWDDLTGAVLLPMRTGKEEQDDFMLYVLATEAPILKLYCSLPYCCCMNGCISLYFVLPNPY